MIFLFVILCLLFALSVRLNKGEETLTKNSCDAIRGLCVIFILFSHISSYIAFDDFGSKYLNAILACIGQLMVAPFFFFSGYGIASSVLKKGRSYEKTILIKHFFKVFLYVFVSLIPYCVLALVNGVYSWADYLLAPIGLASIGNSNWFIFAILFCYLSSGLALLVPFKNKAWPILITSLSVFGYVIAFKLLGYGAWWYDTILCFPLGL